MNPRYFFTFAVLAGLLIAPRAPLPEPQAPTADWIAESNQPFAQ
jgi:hypothetical protein